jgi:electron transport complex protein RnfD
MLDVVIGLLPVVLMALYVFRLYAVKQLAICVVSCLAAEALFTKMRGRSLPLKDCSAVVTGIILALVPARTGALVCGLYRILRGHWYR